MEYLKAVIYLFSVLISGERTEYIVPNVVDIQQVVYVNPIRVLLVNEGSLLEVDILNRSVKEIGAKEGNEFVGYDNGLIFCKIEHYIIQSEDEFSTEFVVLDDKREVVKELRFFETIRPLYIDRDIIVATTAVDFLEKHFYKIDIESKDMEEIFLENIPRKESVVNVREDVFGNVWVSYSMRDMVKIMIATLKPNLKTILNMIPINVPKPALIP